MSTNVLHLPYSCRHLPDREGARASAMEDHCHALVALALRYYGAVLASRSESIAVARGARYNPKIKLVAPLARYFMEA